MGAAQGNTSGGRQAQVAQQVTRITTPLTHATYKETQHETPVRNLSKSGLPGAQLLVVHRPLPNMSSLFFASLFCFFLALFLGPPTLPLVKRPEEST